MTSQQPAASHEIARKVSKGVGWNYLSYGLSKTISLVTVSFLAHLLAPESFGVVALATLAIEYLSIFNDFGLATALIQRREDIEEASNIVFTINLIISISLTIITILISPLVASFFREPELTSILRWLGFSFTLNALGSVHKARLQREMQFGRKLIPEIGNNIVKGIVAIGLATAGYGAWSLVYAQLSGMGVSIILLWVVIPWIPRFTLITKTASQLFNYGFSIMADKALTIFGDSFDYFLIGRLFTSATLGIYTLAYKLPELLIITTLNVLAGVFFPAFSTIQDQPEALKKSFLATTKYVQLLVTPICLGMVVAADPIIRVAFGAQWLESIPLMQILSMYTLVLSIGYHAGDVYKAIGRPDILISQRRGRRDWPAGRPEDPDRP
jgi:PST family polysaccharide transporter